MIAILNIIKKNDLFLFIFFIYNQKMYRKFKSGYFHNNNIKYNKFEFAKTKMIHMKLDDLNNLTKSSSKNIYSFSESNETRKMLAHRDNSYKLTDDDYYYVDSHYLEDDYSDYY